jgi:hypothetical protein
MRNLIFLAFVLLFWSCEMQPIEELAIEPETVEQIQGPYQVTPVSKSTILSLGKKLQKRIGFNVIESAQMRQLSDFTFDLEASLVNTDTLKRRTYTIPFLEKGDHYSTFNLVMVADSVDNVLDHYVLQYEFDSIQYQTFEETGDFLVSGVTIKRFPFSSFFIDSSPGLLERCDGVFDSNGDPIACETISNIANATLIGGGGGSTYSGSTTYTIEFGGGGSISCQMVLTKVECPSPYHNNSSGCIHNTSPTYIFTWDCRNSADKRENTSYSSLNCQNCDISNFGAPAFTLTRDATQINNLLSNYPLSDWHMQYLSLNPAFSNEFRSLLQSESNLDQKAAMITLSAQMEGVIGSKMTRNFGLAIDNMVEADLSNPAILNLFSTYFSARAAFLKLSNPEKYLKNPNGNPKDPNNINQWTLFYDTFKEAIHWSLDLAGFVPFLGEPADLLNAGLYFLEGDAVNATISAASAIPLYGIIASGSRMGWKVIAATTDIQSKRILKWVVNDKGIISFGFRSDLAKNFPTMNTATHQAHHVIPWSTRIQEHPVVQKAADWGFHMNELLNGIPVKKEINSPNHNIYNNYIEQKINLIQKNFPENKWHEELIKLVNKAKAAIAANPNTHLDQISFR